jgi:hypothetical protein
VTAGMLIRVFVGITLLAASPLWAQDATSGGAEAAATGPTSDGAMLTPAPISGQGYSMGFTSETRSNYLRGGLMFSTAYDSDATTGTNGQPISDVSYSIFPTISLDQTRSRLHWVFNYTPGFTFYQKTSSLNQADQNLGVNLSYRLSPHVTLNVRDSFQKTSNVLNQPISDLSNPVSGGVTTPNNSVIAPIADTLTNNANVSLTYQFSANGMVGASGMFTNLHYPNEDQVPGLSDSSSRGGSAFYNHRLSKMHYIGATYQYQMFLAYPTVGQSETQTNTFYGFYTIYLKPTLSVSFFAGPQYSNTQQVGVPTTTGWSPAGGASMSWQGKLTSFAASYSHSINSGSGLSGAVEADTAAASFRRQLTRWLSMSLGGGYANNDVLQAFPTLNNGGQTIQANASVQRQIGEHFNVQAQYTHLHQTYDQIAAISSVPNRNRVAVMIAYQFSRPLGR